MKKKRFLAVFIAMAWAYVAIAEPAKHPVQNALDDGNLDQARILIDRIPTGKDPWLGKLALAQLKSGSTDDAKNTMRRIRGSSELTSAAHAIAQHSRGGGTGADFDSLINLITSTVEPNSWDEVGGPGTVMAFPGGVAVDSQGVVARAPLKKLPSALRFSTSITQGVSRQESNLRMISLPRLERELAIRLAMGEDPTDAMTHLAGLYEIRYVFVLPESNDVVIAGPAAAWSQDATGRAVTNKGRPVLLLDDLVTLMRNAREQQGKFGCSIDPKRENLAATQAFLSRPTGPLKPSQTRRWVDQIRDTLGLQDIRVYGIDPASHVARVIVEADYHMKLIGMGLEPGVDGLDSYLDSINKNDVPKKMDVLRWWFTLRPDGLFQSEDGLAFEFASQVVRLQSENETISREGNRARTGGSSELNQQFAQQFTNQFEQLRREYPLYAELENLFRMAMIAGVLESPEVKSKVEWEAGWFKEVLRPAKGASPEEVASIVNHRVINRRHVVVGVSGGVTVNVAQYLRKLRNVKDEANIRSAGQVADRRFPVTSGQWWWDN